MDQSTAVQYSWFNGIFLPARNLLLTDETSHTLNYWFSSVGIQLSVVVLICLHAPDLALILWFISLYLIV